MVAPPLNNFSSPSDIDKFEMYLQAYEYEKEQGTVLEQFYSSHKNVRNPIVAGWIEELMKRRNALPQIQKEQK